MRVLKAISALMLSLLILVGIPLALWHTVGNPLDAWPDLAAGDISDRAVTAVLAAVAYLAWAQFTVAFAVELLRALAILGRPASTGGPRTTRRAAPVRIPLVFGFQQQLARTLVTAMLLLTTVATTVGAALPAWAASTPTMATAFAASSTAPTAAADSTATAHTEPVAKSAQGSYVVRADGPRTWWDLAQQHLGTGDRWPELWDLNHGTVQADGQVLAAPGPLRIGWTVHLPHAAATAAAAPVPIGTAADRSPAPHGTEVTVRPGDTLSGIAASHGIADWVRVWQANAGRPEPDGATFDDPDYIEPGWQITLPEPADPPFPASGEEEVTVRAGDTLSGIAASHGIADWAQVWQANSGRTEPGGAMFDDPDYIEPDWQITIPRPAHTSPPTAGTDPAAAQPTGAAPDSHSQSEHTDSGLGTGGTSIPPEDAPPDAQRPVASAADPTAADQDQTRTTPADKKPAATSHQPAATATPQPTATTAAPFAEPAHTSVSADDQDPAAATDDASWPVLAGGGGVLLLAGASYLALGRTRRRQARYRRPGHPISPAPPRLRRMEQALLTVGPDAAQQASRLDQAMRGLAFAVRNGHLSHLPDVVAARIGSDRIELLLARAHKGPPEPWHIQHEGLCWLLPPSAAVHYDDAAERERTLAPYPALVSIGHTLAGEQWLLDLEQIGALRLTGPAQRCRDLLRFMAAELAHNTWSEMLTVTAAGLGDELAPLNPDRLTLTDHHGPAARALHRQIADVRLDRQSGVSVLDGRADGGNREVWPPRVLLVAGSDSSNDDPDDAVLADLVGDLQSDPERGATSVVVTGKAALKIGWQVRLDDDGLLHLPDLDIHAVAEQLPESEAAQLAQLLAAAVSTEGVATPLADDDEVGQGDATGAPPLDQVNGTDARPQLHVAGRPTPAPDRILPLPTDEYTKRAATTAQDVHTLAPRITDDRRDKVQHAVSGLDADLADWYDPSCPRPKVTLLGPVTVTASGELPTDKPRLAWNTEIVAFLVSQPHGATAEQYGTALWPGDPAIVGKSKVRQSIHIVRRWLGENPRTGRDHLPTNPGVSGIVYRIEDALVDADLFRQLRQRGVARGADGIADLQAALNLVSGVPFDRRRPGGYGWLADTALDHQYTAMIVDVAHTVATHHLADSNPEAAAAAAEVALLAGSYEDTPLLDLAAACEARGMHAEVDMYVRRIMNNHDVEEEVDLPPRTFEILHRRGWLREAG
jgi:LysM repeat protein